MPFTASATTELAQYVKDVGYTLRLKSPHSGGWVEYNFADWRITHGEDAPSTARFSLINTSLTYSDEDRTTAAIPTIVRGLVQFVCQVGTETQIIFDGRIHRVEPRDHEFVIQCVDWSELANECLCDVSLEPTRVEVVGEHAATAIQITQINASLGASYGFPAGTANAFSATDARRSWARTNIRVYDSATVSSATEYAPATYSIDYTSGAIKILDHDHASKSYYVTNVQAYKESAAAGATNVDVARLYQQAWEHPALSGGPGFTEGHYDLTDTGIDVDRAFRFKGRIADLDRFIREELGVFIKQRWDHGATDDITGINLSANTITIAGDYTGRLVSGYEFDVANSTGNDGAYTVDSSALVGSDTVITVNEALADPTVDGVLHLPKLKVSLVAQKDAGSEDWDLQHPVSIGQPRDDSDLYTSVTVRGKKSLPVNRVTWAAQNGYIYDDTTAGNWFKWDGLNVGANSTFAAVIPSLYDGDGNTAAAVHNLAFPETDTPGSTYSGGTSKYSEWYNFAKIRIEEDANDPQLIQRVDAYLPGSRNINAQAGDQRVETGGDAVGFWPGILLLASEDDTTYYQVSPMFYGTFKPGSEETIQGDDIVQPRARWVKVLLRAYKHGDKNQADPGIGLAHLGIYTDIEYEITRGIYPYIHAITGVDILAGTFTIAGDYAADFAAGSTLEVLNSTGNDTTYTVVVSAVYGAATVITVTEAISDPTVDGDLAPCYVETDGTTWRRGYPGLWARFGGRYKSKEIDLGDKFDEHIANDVAIRYLQESIRLFQAVSFEAVCDPRVRLYDTVTVTDELNGDIGSILVTRIELGPESTRIEGTNYRADEMEAP